MIGNRAFVLQVVSSHSTSSRKRKREGDGRYGRVIIAILDAQPSSY